MRYLLGTLLVSFVVTGSYAQDDKIPDRLGVAVNLDFYPQGSPKAALASVLKAIKNERSDYILAHLMEPGYVDKRMKETRSTPIKMQAEIAAHMKQDAEVATDLKAFSLAGETTETDQTAVIKLKDVNDRAIYMKRIGSRWYMENRRTTVE